MGNKHAFLIGAYKNPDYLKRLILSLNSEKSNVYVHINRLNFEDFIHTIDFFKDYKNVKFLSSVKVKWGGQTLLESIEVLAKEALKNKDNQYFHLITGQDMLVRPLQELFDFFHVNVGKNFISYGELPQEEFKRYFLYHLFDLFDVRSRKLTYVLESVFVKLQLCLGFERKSIFKHMYWGSGWWSLQREALEYAMLQLESQIDDRMRHTFAPDEMIFQSLLLNSNHDFHIINNNLRFMIWNGSSGPKVLDEKDYKNILDSHCFFARKIEPTKSDALIKLIENKRNN